MNNVYSKYNSSIKQSFGVKLRKLSKLVSKQLLVQDEVPKNFKLPTSEKILANRVPSKR